MINPGVEMNVRCDHCDEEIVWNAETEEWDNLDPINGIPCSATGSHFSSDEEIMDDEWINAAYERQAEIRSKRQTTSEMMLEDLRLDGFR